VTSASLSERQPIMFTDDTDEWNGIDGMLPFQGTDNLSYRHNFNLPDWIPDLIRNLISEPKGDTRKRIPQLKSKPRKRFLNANREIQRSINLRYIYARRQSSSEESRCMRKTQRNERVNVCYANALRSVPSRPRDSITRIRCRDYGGRNRAEKGSKNDACIDAIG
jgi:hypothetical protein